jgi:hypothetical protein
MSTTNPPIPHFAKLGPRISLFTPATPTPGHLIILCTWLGAARKHIDKYITAYLAIAPSAKILLLQSDVRTITSSYAAQRQAIVPAVEAVRSVLDERAQGNESNDDSKVMFHTFSNGGPNSATHLLTVLREIRKTPLPIIGILCDSGPAKGDYWRSYNAMTRALPPSFPSILGIPVVHFICIVLYGSVAIGRYEKPEDLFRRTLLSEEMVVLTGTGEGEGKGRICYVYSKEDRMVDWRDVVEHADVARGMGWEVEEWVVEGTAHCNHFRGKEESYERKMRGMWMADVERSKT